MGICSSKSEFLLINTDIRHARECTMAQNNQESSRKYWATRSSVRSFTRTAHSFACSALLASLARSAVLICSLAHSLTHSQARGKVNE